MKKILSLIIISIFLLNGCTPVKYVMVDPKDSTKLVEVRKRIIYDDYYTSPLFFNFYNRQLYYTPRIYVPINPRQHYVPRGGRH